MTNQVSQSPLARAKPVCLLALAAGITRAIEQDAVDVSYASRHG
jgi:hypothetical protein